MMFVRVNDAAVPAVSAPAVNVTVNTLDVKVAVAAGVPPMPMKPKMADRGRSWFSILTLFFLRCFTWGEFS